MILSQTSAGGIVFRTRGQQIEVCLILDDYGSWTFPKGKIEPGETLEQAAVREVGEEVGIADVRLGDQVGASSYRFPLGNDICKKTVHWFLMQAPPDTECTPVRSEHVQDAGWFGPQQALRTVGYRNLRPLLRRALDALGASTEQ